MTPGASSSVCQNRTALKMPSAVKCMSRCLRPLSSGGQRMLKCHASTGSMRGRYMPSPNGAPAPCKTPYIITRGRACSLPSVSGCTSCCMCAAKHVAEMGLLRGCQSQEDAHLLRTLGSTCTD